MESCPSDTHNHQKLAKIGRLAQTLAHRTALFPKPRWAVLIVFLIWSVYQMIARRCFVVICIQGFYTIYLVLNFCTPSGIPLSPNSQEMEMDNLEESQKILEWKESESPLLRTLDEFKLWRYMSTLALVGWLCSNFELLAIPIYSPFLVGYLVWLVWLAVRRHFQQSEFYGFVLSDFLVGKQVRK